MNKKFLLFIVVIAVLSILMVNKFFDRERNRALDQTIALVVGTSADYAPFSFIENNTIVGFDIDVVTEIARRLGLQLTLKDMAFDVLLLELQRGSIEVVAAGLTVTPDRAEKVLFTTPYLQGDPLLALTKIGYTGVIAVYADLVGKKVIVNEGFTADIYLSQKPGITLERVETVAQGILALSQGKGDVYVIAQHAYQPYRKTVNEEKFTAHVLAGTEENCALAISKKYPELFLKIKQTMNEMVEDGTIANLKNKWLHT